MTKSDPILARITAQFPRHDAHKSGAGYLIIDRATGAAVARLRPIPETDWSRVRLVRVAE